MIHNDRSLNKPLEYIPADTMDALTHYPWPGNVRGLENLIERAVLLSPSKELRVPLAELKSVSVPTPGPQRGLFFHPEFGFPKSVNHDSLEEPSGRSS